MDPDNSPENAADDEAVEYPKAVDDPNMDLTDELIDELTEALEKINTFCDMVAGEGAGYWTDCEFMKDRDLCEGDTPADCARLAAIVSFDHLHYFARYSVETRRVSAFAPFTVVRSALTAAATAAWILEDMEPAERRRRALIFRYQNAVNQRTAVLGIVSAPSPEKASKSFRERREEAIKTKADAESEMALVLADASRSGIPDADVKIKPKDAKIIQIGSRLTAEHPLFEEFSLTTEVLLHWQSLSASAHGQPWAALLSAKTLMGPDGVPVGRWSPSHDLLIAGYRLTWLTLHGMWQRYLQLAGDPLYATR